MQFSLRVGVRQRLSILGALFNEIFAIHFAADTRDADGSKDRRSTDLFLKGLYLSFFESNDAHPADYRNPELPLRKRNIHSNRIDFPAMRNYNKLVVDFSKLANYNETRHIYRNLANETDTTTESNTDRTAKQIIHPTTVPEQTTYATNQQSEQPFLIAVY